MVGGDEEVFSRQLVDTRDRMSDEVRELFRSSCQLGTLRLPSVGNGGDDYPKRRHARSFDGREVGAGMEGLAVRGEEHRHGPAAPAGHGLERLHVDGVDVGTFFTVDFDVDEQLVHQCRRLGILE